MFRRWDIWGLAEGRDGFQSEGLKPLGKVRSSQKSVELFAKVPYLQHHYNTRCLNKERFCLGLFGSMEAKAMACMDERLGVAEMFWQHLGIALRYI